MREVRFLGAGPIMKKHTFWDWHENNKHCLRWPPRLISVSLDYKELGWGYFGWRPWQMLKWHGYLPELWYYLRCRFWTKYNTVKADTLPPTWVDRDKLLLHAMFAILCDVVEGEDWFNSRSYYCKDEANGPACDWDGKDEFQEVALLYDWWKHRRPARDKAVDNALSAWSDEFRKLGGMTFMPAEGHLSRMVFPEERHGEAACAKEYQLKELHTNLEAAAEQEDEEMMIRLCKISGYLWT
jgi:hypothetical protein